MLKNKDEKKQAQYALIAGSVKKTINESDEQCKNIESNEISSNQGTESNEIEFSDELSENTPFDYKKALKDCNISYNSTSEKEVNEELSSYKSGNISIDFASEEEPSPNFNPKM